MIKKLLDATLELGRNLVDAVNNYTFELKHFVFTKDVVNSISFADDFLDKKSKKKKGRGRSKKSK
jgi:hypothetical protein